MLLAIGMSSEAVGLHAEVTGLAKGILWSNLLACRVGALVARHD